GAHGQTIRAALGEVARTLRPGGVFVDGTRPLDLARIDATISNRWKNLLAQMIADTVRGTVGNNSGLSHEDETQLTAQLGLKKYSYNMSGWGAGVNVYVKGKEIKDAGYHTVPGRGVEHFIMIVEPEI